jgi:tetratricopeptide (TPR) repeat protein
MLEWSHRLLSERERTVLRRLSVFAGHFNLAAAQHVCAGDGLESFQVLDVIAALVDKSLVETESFEDATRYRLLESIRHYASERLDDAGESSSVSAAHLDWYLLIAERAEVGLTGAEQVKWLDELEADYENLRAALGWACQNTGSRDDLRLAAALSHFWLVRGRLSEGRGWLDDSLDRHPTPRDALRVKGECASAFLACFAGDLDRAAQAATAALVVARQLRLRGGEARALVPLGLVSSGKGRFDEAERRHRMAVTAGHDASDDWVVSFALTNLGNMLALRGATSEARRCYEESLSIRRKLGDLWGLTWTLFRLGGLSSAEGRLDEAITELEEALQRSYHLHFGQGIVLALLGLGEVHHVSGDQLAANQRFTDALRKAREIEEPSNGGLALAGLAHVALATGDVEGAARWLQEEEADDPDIALATRAALVRSRATLHAARGSNQLAETSHQEALRLRQELGDHRGMTEQLEELALLAFHRGDLELAARLLGGAAGARLRMQFPVLASRDTALNEVTGNLTTPREKGGRGLEAVWLDGASLPLAEVVALATFSMSPSTG